jgi:4-amino-4-deoxy-L-arabinose transferase-like glycosyltransferase
VLTSDKSQFTVVALFAFLILLAGLYSGDLRGYDDALYAHEAKQMIQTGDWWTVRFNGRVNFQYPPMFMWLEALSMKVFGMTDFAARFPVAVLGFGTILLTYALAFELTGERWLSLLSMAVMLSTQYFLKYSTHAMTDVPCTFFVLVAMYSYVRGLRTPAYFIVSGVGLAFAIMTRSIVGLFPFPVFVAHLILTRNFRKLLSLQALTGFLLALAIPAVWFVSQYRMHGSFFTSQVISFFGERFSSDEDSFWSRALALLTYPKLFLTNYWPWLPVLVVGLVKQFRRALLLEPAALLLMLWIGAFIVPFSIAHDKILRYLMPAFPAFSIMVATSLNDWLPSHRRQQVWNGIAVLGLAGVLSVFLIRVFSPEVPGDMHQLASIAESNSPPNQHIVLYTSGRTEYDINNQLLWYSNRFTELPIVLEGVKAYLQDGEHTVAIMDRESYKQFPELLGTGFQVEVLGRSEKFVCFKAAPPRTDSGARTDKPR